MFFDYNGIASGDFEGIILSNINARAHFLVLLTPSALERCNEPKDLLKREIETAMETRRNVVPLMLEGFDFASPGISSQLTGGLTALKNYNGLRVPAEYFSEAMNRLREKYLNIPLDAVLHPASPSAQQAAREQQNAAGNMQRVSEEELSAQEWFERGINSPDNTAKIYRYSQALRIMPNYPMAFVNRGNAYFASDDVESALIDYSEAIRLKTDYAVAFYNRAVAHYAKNSLEKALQDYEEALGLGFDLVNTLTARGLTRSDSGYGESALEHFSQAIRLKPAYALAFHWRGVTRKTKGDLNGAIADFSEAIRLKDQNASALYCRALLFRDQHNYKDAIEDLRKYLDSAGHLQNDDREQVEQWIEVFTSKLSPLS